MARPATNEDLQRRLAEITPPKGVPQPPTATPPTDKRNPNGPSDVNYETLAEPDPPTDRHDSNAPSEDIYDITVRRGGVPWPVNPAVTNTSNEARQDQWVAPTEPLGIDGKPVPDPPAPEKTAPQALQALVQAIAGAFRTQPEVEPDGPPAWADELRDWWVDTASSDISGSIDKIIQYGGRGAAYDLIATGHDLAAMNGRKVDDEEASELAILFYASSKLNRWMAAAIDGRRPSDDTIFDISHYAMMARRNRAVGGWPTA